MLFVDYSLEAGNEATSSVASASKGTIDQHLSYKTETTTPNPPTPTVCRNN